MIVVNWSGVVSAVWVAGVEHMVAVIGCCCNVTVVSLMTRYSFVSLFNDVFFCCVYCYFCHKVASVMP